MDMYPSYTSQTIIETSPRRIIAKIHHPLYEIIVGNVGRVYETTIDVDAKAIYDRYVLISLHGYGRASGETVDLLCDGEIVESHAGSFTSLDQ